MKFLKFLLLLLIIVFIVPIAIVLIKYFSLPTQSEKPLNILIAGIAPVYPPSEVWPYPAAPEDFTGLADTIVLAQVYSEGKINLLSIPRDSWVQVNGKMDKINISNAEGGIDLLQNTVQDLIGIKIDNYILFSTHAIRAITDSAGGIIVNVEKPMKYQDVAGNLFIDLNAGTQKLNGKEVEGYLRFRKDGMGDIGRIARQQEFMRSFIDQMTSINKIIYLPSIIQTANSNIKTNLTRNEMGILLSAGLKKPQPTTYLLPGNFGEKGSWSVNHEEINELIDKNFIVKDKSLEHLQNIHISIFNVQAPQGSAKALAEKLKTLGLKNIDIDNKSGTLKHSTASSKNPEIAIRFGLQPIKTDDENITIELGSDFDPNKLNQK